MNRRMGLGLGMVAVAVAAFVVYNMMQESGRLPDKVFERMEFGGEFGLLTGNEKGVVCHQVFLCQETGCEMLVSHKLWHHDFRTMTEAQKRAAIISDTQRDMEDVGLACTKPDGSIFLSEAWAQPHCSDCGGGCDSRSCPGTIGLQGGCSLGGVNCAITFICCSGGCPNC